MKSTIPFILMLMFQGATLANPRPLGRPVPIQKQEPLRANNGGLLQGMLSDWKLVTAGVTTIAAISGLAYYYFKRRTTSVPVPKKEQDKEEDVKESDEDTVVLEIPRRRGESESSRESVSSQQGTDLESNVFGHNAQLLSVTDTSIRDSNEDAVRGVGEHGNSREAFGALRRHSIDSAVGDQQNAPLSQVALAQDNAPFSPAADRSEREESVGLGSTSHTSSFDSESDDEKENIPIDHGSVVRHLNRLLQELFKVAFETFTSRDFNGVYEFVNSQIENQRSGNAGVVSYEEIRADARVCRLYNWIKELDLIIDYFDNQSQAGINSYAEGNYYKYFERIKEVVHQWSFSQKPTLNTSSADAFSMNDILRTFGWDKDRLLDITTFQSSQDQIDQPKSMIRLVDKLKQAQESKEIKTEQLLFASPLSVLLAIRFSYGLDVWKETQFFLGEGTVAGLQKLKIYRNFHREKIDALEKRLNGQADDIVPINQPRNEQTTNPIESQGFLEYIDQFISDDGSAQPLQILDDACLAHLTKKCGVRSCAGLNGAKNRILLLASKGALWLQELQKWIVSKNRTFASSIDPQLEQLQSRGDFGLEKRDALHEILDKIGGLMWFLFAHSLARGEAFTHEGVFMLLEGHSNGVGEYLKRFYSTVSKLFPDRINPVVSSSTALQGELGNVQRNEVALEFCLHMRYNIDDANLNGTYENVLPPHNYGIVRILILNNGHIYLRPEAVNSLSNIVRSFGQVITKQGAAAGALVYTGAKGIGRLFAKDEARIEQPVVQERPQPVAITRGIRHTGRVAGLVNEFLESRDSQYNSTMARLRQLGSWFAGRSMVSYRQAVNERGLAQIYEYLMDQEGEMRQRLHSWFPHDNKRISNARYGAEIIIEQKDLHRWVNHSCSQLQGR